MIKRKDLKRSIPPGVASEEAREASASFPERKGKDPKDPRKSDVLFYGTDRYRLVTPLIPRAQGEFLSPPDADPD